MSVVLRWMDAEQRGDLDTAAAQFADSAVFISNKVTGNCSQQTPCTDSAGIRQQTQGNIAEHICSTFLTLQVSGAVVTGKREIRSDSRRANGVERTLQSFMAVVPQDKITFFVGALDLADPQSVLNGAINAGTQPAGTPLPNPTTPCAGLS